MVKSFVAIIDIDGNNWSARFNELLCMNSVVIKIEPIFVEQFYEELFPMVHYVPASIDNITATLEYVLDEQNEIEMRRIVSSANEWCKRSITSQKLANDAVRALGYYKRALDAIDANWNGGSMQFEGLVDDLVPCEL